MESDRELSPKPRKPYVSPQVLQVQRRVDGDNMATGCKISTEASVGLSCLQANCFNIGS